MTPLVSLAEIEAVGSAALPEGVADHIAGAAGTEATMRRNALAFESLAFRPRVLRDVSVVESHATFLGGRHRLPVALAPIGSLHTLFPSAPLDAIAAASAFGVPAFVSSVAEPGFEKIAAAGRGARVLQLYIRGDAVVIADVLSRARDAGFGAVALTVDSARYGIRDRQRLAKWQPPATRRGGKEHQARLTWDSLEEITSAAAPMKVMLKGVQTGEDAELAVAHGIDTLYVSNHGGRQLDHCRATLDVLREVRTAVGPDPEILVDGGIRRGTDVIKAMALGANGVGIGRLTAWALGAGGGAGVARMLELLEEEIQNAMALLGVRAWSELHASHVADARPLR